LIWLLHELLWCLYCSPNIFTFDFGLWVKKVGDPALEVPLHHHHHLGVTREVQGPLNEVSKQKKEALRDVLQTSQERGRDRLVLDINTAGTQVSVSEDRRSASYSLKRQRRPQTPERFQLFPQALSARTFPSGRHYWEVEGSESGLWLVGAAYPSIERGGEHSCLGYNARSWGLCRWDNNTYTVRHGSKITDLIDVPNCPRIRIWLDYEAGHLSFYELSEPIRHLHTFSASFTEPLHAAFGVWRENSWVRIIKVKWVCDELCSLVFPKMYIK
uniref:B30.2/SPRY domain-containing protein n=1 Tax=Xenopus tropicalis TaxID=8364 RepID=L7N3Z5_XENTR